MNMRNGFTLIEVLVTVAIMAVLAIVLLPKLPFIKRQADLTVARGQVVRVQTALDSWLSGQASVAGARNTFAGSSPTTDYPTDPALMLGIMKEYLNEDSQALFYVDPDDPDRLATDTMKEHGWYFRLKWPGVNWVATHPRVEFHGP